VTNEKVLKSIVEDIEKIIATMPPNANRRDKIKQICLRVRIKKEAAKSFI
jgi:hypothetical protein